MQLKIPSIVKLFFIFIHYATIFPKISSIMNVDWPWLAKVGLWVFLRQLRLTSWVIHVFTWGVGQSFLHKKWLARVAMNNLMDEHCSRQPGANKMGWPYGCLTQIGLAWKVNCFFKLWWSIRNQGKGSSNCQDNHFLPRKVIVKHWMFHCVTTFYSKSKLYQVLLKQLS
jgi:hypothetical protein